MVVAYLELALTDIILLMALSFLILTIQIIQLKSVLEKVINITKPYRKKRP